MFSDKLIGLATSENMGSPEDSAIMEKLLGAAFDAAKARDFLKEKTETWKALFEFVSEKGGLSQEEYSEVIRSRNKGSLFSQAFKSKSSSNDLVKTQADLQNLAADLIAKFISQGRLMVGANLVKTYRGSSSIKSVALWSDRILTVGNVGKLSKTTKVLMSVDGTTQIYQSGSWTSGLGTEAGIGAVTSQRFSTVDLRSAQLVVSDLDWQFSIEESADKIAKLRAFAEAIQVHLDSTFSKSPGDKMGSSKSLSEELLQLNELKKTGILNEEEFQSAKKKLLS